MASCVCRSYNAQKMSCFLLFGTIFCKVNEMFTRVFQSKAYIFQHCFAMVNSSKFVETHFLAFYDLLLLGQPMENNRYSAIHSRFAHSNYLSHFPFPDRISTLLIILNKFIDAGMIAVQFIQSPQWNLITIMFFSLCVLHYYFT